MKNASARGVTKWSTKPVDHDATRVRNNQRRHRERVRSRISDLESHLSATQLQLRDALLKIDCLSRELQDIRASTCLVDASHPASLPPWHLRQGPVLSETDSQDTVINEEDYCNLQPPDPTESTTRCRDAYEIIAKQNYAHLDREMLDRWLRPGFRGPVCEGDGCRVQNQLLFALLDYLNSL